MRPMRTSRDAHRFSKDIIATREVRTMNLRDDKPKTEPEKQEEPPPPKPRQPDIDPGVVIIAPWPMPKAKLPGELLLE